MAVSAVLRTTQVTVAPGGAARCHVLIRNNSAVVDQFAFTVRGDVVDWTEVKPARVNLMPQQEVSVELTFTPPRSPEVLAGEHAFALMVASREDPAGSVVQEGLLTLDQFTEVEAAVVPVTSTSRRTGKHTLAVDNLGNHSHGVEVSATDADSRLTFKVKPRAPRVEPGTATFVRVVAKPKKYFWRGENRLLPFTIRVLGPDGAPIEVEAALDQAALLPRRFVRLFAILLALLLVLVILITTILRQRPLSLVGRAPIPSSTAPPPSTTATPSSTAPPPPSSAPAPTTAAPAPPPARVGGAGSAATTGRTTPAPAPVTTTFTIGAQAYPGVGGGPQLFSYVVPDGPRHRVTSVLLRNPAADVGQVQIRHDGAVVGTVDLAAVDRDGGDGLLFRPDNPPLVAPGESLVLAVSCGNERDPCTPQGVFTAALVR
ncbi:COG1470 family protein [Actinokineospora pegani]|uniref:COG1470 family protein n=1 Tax=Actinokineospora pegani TaxID=2654637 RepID=UPI0012EA1F81|nr:hypothetical protein [Actinokineospora pegani]